MCNINAQDTIKLEKSGGVYLIPCKVNDLPLKFIYDTGASEVSISLTEALFMLKNGYLKESDIKGTVYYSIANGDIAEGTKINIQKIEVGKQTLYNVEASIVHSTEAPLLFGQSAMERFGKFTMDYSNSNLIIGGSSNSSSTNSTNSNTIKSVKIGTQTWMTENLNVDRFRNGDLIPEAKTDEQWNNAGQLKQPAWCYYKNDSTNGAKYGKLYNWYAVNDTRGLSPKGWHVPSYNEFLVLRKFIGQMEGGKKMKATSDWEIPIPDIPPGNGTNSSGFNGFPGGWRYLTGQFNGLHTNAEFWTSTTNYNQYTKDQNAKFFCFYLRVDLLDESYNDKGQGRSIRCIKD